MHPAYASLRYRIWLVIERVLAVLALLTLLPLFALLYCAVRLTSRGPFFYSQMRPGRGGECFKIWKIRTMAVGSDRDVTNAMAVRKDNPQVTRVGKILRELKIDELPQLWNVVCGQMELVGPRPIAAALNERLLREIPGFSARATVRPGLTNLGQITILDNQEAHRVKEDWNVRFEGECHYLQNKSVHYDVILLVLTVVFILRKIFSKLRRKRTDAVPAEQTPATAARSPS